MLKFEILVSTGLISLVGVKIFGVKNILWGYFILFDFNAFQRWFDVLLDMSHIIWLMLYDSYEAKISIFEFEYRKSSPF